MKQMLLALGAGGVAGGIVWFFARQELERDFGKAAEALRTRLHRKGSAFASETKDLCETSARAALKRELARLGLTEDLLRDAAESLEFAVEIAELARRIGVSASELRSILRARF